MSTRKIDSGEWYTNPSVATKITENFIKKCMNKYSKSEFKICEFTVGDGVFLIEIKKQLLKYGYTEKQLQRVVYAVDLHQDSVIKCIEKWYGKGKIEILKGNQIPSHMKSDGLIAVFKHNGNIVDHIVQADSTVYPFNFHETHTTNLKIKKDRSINDLFEIT